MPRPGGHIRVRDFWGNHQKWWGRFIGKAPEKEGLFTPLFRKASSKNQPHYFIGQAVSFREGNKSKTGNIWSISRVQKDVYIYIFDFWCVLQRYLLSLPRFGELWNILEQSHRNDLVSVQLSNEQRTPSCLEYIGDYTTQLNGEFFFLLLNFFSTKPMVSVSAILSHKSHWILVGFWGAWPWVPIPTWFLREAPLVASPSGQCLDSREFGVLPRTLLKDRAYPYHPCMVYLLTFG